jgi:hypothetical protein
MRKVLLFCLLFFLFSCEKQVVIIQEDKKDVEIDNVKRGYPDDYNIPPENPKPRG